MLNISILSVNPFVKPKRRFIELLARAQSGTVEDLRFFQVPPLCARV